MRICSWFKAYAINTISLLFILTDGGNTGICAEEELLSRLEYLDNAPTRALGEKVGGLNVQAQAL